MCVYFLDGFCSFPFYTNCGVVSLFIFFRKKRSKKSVVTLESLRFQGRSPRQDTLWRDLMEEVREVYVKSFKNCASSYSRPR